MPTLLTTNPEIFIPGITKGVKLYDVAPKLAVWREIVKTTMNCNDRGEVKLLSHGDMQLPTPFGGTVGPMSEVDYDLIYARSYKPVRIGAKHSVDQLAIQIEHIGDGGEGSIISALSEKFGLAYLNYKNMVAADLLNGAFSSTTTSDTIAAISHSHTLASGTHSNRGDGTNDLVLSYSALETAIQRHMATKSHKGNPSSVVGPFDLVVPTAMAGLANRLTSSVGLPGTNNNDKNYAGSQMRVVCLPWLTSDTAYFVNASTSIYHNMFYVPQRAWKMETDVDRDYDTKRIYTSEIFGFGWHDWRGTWGTTG